MNSPKAVFNWSSGKDSALAFYKIQQSQEFDVTCLLTTLSREFQRVSMHGVRVDLLQAQSDSLDIPLLKVQLSDSPSMEQYERSMREAFTQLKQQGVQHSIFGDILLEDLRAYRENRLSELEVKAVFPLWNQPTDQLIHEFLALGFKAITTCVNEKYLDKSFVGRVIDADFLNDLPEEVDPCGENGEFHTFVFDGPNFKQPIAFEKGELVLRKYEAPKTDEEEDQCFSSQREDPSQYGFWYCDLIPV